MRNNFYDETKKIKGYIENDKCFDNYGRFVCYLLASGEFVTSTEHGTILYKIHSDGTLTKGTSNNICGYINPDGCLTKTRSSSMKEIIGSFDYYPLTSTNEEFHSINNSNSPTQANKNSSKYNPHFAPEWMISFNIIAFIGLFIWGLCSFPTNGIGIIYSVFGMFISSKLHQRGYRSDNIHAVFFIIHIFIIYNIVS